MRHRYTSPALVAVMALAVSACDSILEPRDHLYDGPPVVEFAPILPAGTYTRTVAFSAGSAEDRDVSVRINYVGAPAARDLSGSFTVASGSTGVEGTHFTVAGGKQFTIPAGANVADIAVTLHGSALQDGDAVTIILELVDGQDVDVSERYKRFTISASKAGG